MLKPNDNPVISLKVLPGEKTDGSGQVCIHLFVRDPKGCFVEPHVLHRAAFGKRKLVAKPTRGRLACDPIRQARPRKLKNGAIEVTMRSDDPRAVSCLKCKASSDYKSLMDQIERGGVPSQQD